MNRSQLNSLPTLAEYGPRGHTVRVYIERGLVRVRWSEDGTRRFRSWSDTPANRRDAKAWARAFYDARVANAFAPAARPSLTMVALWEAYQLAEFGHLRDSTRRNYTDYWRTWQAYIGDNTLVDEVRREALDRYVVELSRIHVASEVRRFVKFVAHVYGWGVERELTMAAKVGAYRVKLPRDAMRSEPTAEFREDDAEKLLAHFDPRESARARTKWRAYVIQTILHLCGARINAVLHLRCDDLDLEARTVVWRSEWDKTGKERVQPLPQRVVDALRTALAWRERDGYEGPWVFYSSHAKSRAADKPFTYSAYSYQLHKGEKAADVAHIAGRGAHGFRRGAVGNVVDLTGGDVERALEWVGDRDMRMARLYVKGRDDRMRGVADLLDKRTQTAPTTPASSPNKATKGVAPLSGLVSPSLAVAGAGFEPATFGL